MFEGLLEMEYQPILTTSAGYMVLVMQVFIMISQFNLLTFAYRYLSY